MQCVSLKAGGKAPCTNTYRRSIVAQGGLRWPLSLLRSPVKRQRDELLQNLLLRRDSPLPIINGIIDELAESKQPFKPAALGRGPWVVVYTRGPAQLWKAMQSVASSLTDTKNRASQEFDPRTNGALNKAEFGSPEFFVTASGSYEVQGQSRTLPVQVQANIEEGRLHAWGRQLPLPIRGTGKFWILYLDDKVRIFKSGSSYSVQVQCDELENYLRQPKIG